MSPKTPNEFPKIFEQPYGGRMSAAAFGKQLIKTGDLDPIYNAIYGAKLPDVTRNKLLLAYWCLYHLGAASKIAESKNFWRSLGVAAVNEGLKWPRGAERRHWRGANALNSFNHLKKRFKTPCHAVEYFGRGTGGQGSSFFFVSARVREITGFGPWIAFKVADMLERIAEHPISFDNCELGIYDEPRRGAALYLHGDEDTAISLADVKTAAGMLQAEIGGVLAPPRGDRYVNIQEVETVLCKWKAHKHGRYSVGHDIEEVRRGLFDQGDLATQLLRHTPKGVKGYAG